jgi:hypothetical protein
MKTIELSDVSALSPHLQPGCDEPVVVRSEGRTLAAVVPVNEEDVESLLLSINPRFQRILERSEERLKSEGALSAAEVRRRLAASSQ